MDSEYVPGCSSSLRSSSAKSIVDVIDCRCFGVTNALFSRDAFHGMLQR